MARGKKKEAALSPAERLQAALVPESEQPYQVPENWCWVRVSSVCEFERGITFPASAKETEPTNTNIPCLRTANVQDELEINNLIYVDKSYMKGNQAKLVKKNDIIMSSANSRELVGKTSYVYDVPFPMTFGGFVLTIRAKAIISKYLFYFLRLEFLSGHFMGESTQTTNIANINTTKLGGYALSLPPLPEQQRIVDRIESLFAKLDEAKQKAQDALDSFETRKAAILHKAFTGELTAQWRKEHGVGMESWENRTMGEIASFHQGVQVAVDEQFEDSGENRVRFIRIVDYTQGTEKERYVSKDKVRTESFVKGNEIVMVRYGATAGFVGEGIEGLLANNMFVVNVRESIREYIKIFLRSPAIYNKLNTSGGSTAMPALNFKTVSAIEVPLPSEKEQTEIVRILDDLLAKEQQAKEAAEKVLEQIDLTKKAILARAFRGELGTNDPNEESAVELLKETLQKTERFCSVYVLDNPSSATYNGCMR